MSEKKPSRKRAPRAGLHPLDMLPTVKPPSRGEGRHFWTVPRTGDHGADYALGVGLATETRKFMPRDAFETTAWVWIVRDMVRGGTFGGVELGFLTAMFSYFKVGSYLFERYPPDAPPAPQPVRAEPVPGTDGVVIRGPWQARGGREA